MGIRNEGLQVRTEVDTDGILWHIGSTRGVNGNAERRKGAADLFFRSPGQVVRFPSSLKNQVDAFQWMSGLPLHHLISFDTPAGLLKHRDELIDQPADILPAFRTCEPDAVDGHSAGGLQSIDECAAFLRSEGVKRFGRMGVFPVRGHPNPGYHCEYRKEQDPHSQGFNPG